MKRDHDMERGRGMAQQQPAAKRARMTMAASVEDGAGAGTGSGEASSLRSSKLRPTFFMVLFAVRMIERNPVPSVPSLSQIENTVQRIVDCAFNQFQEMVSSKLEKAFQAFQGQIDNIHHEVREMANLCSNRHADQQAILEPNQEHAAANGSNTNIRLCFLNDLKPPVYTEKNMTDKNNATIKVAMYEGGKKITFGPLSKVQVEVLVLRGEFCNSAHDDWTEEEFDNHIVQGRGEQGLLGTVRLTNGEAELSQIRFKKATCRKSVILGARVCKGENIAVRVKEAVMKPVVVQDRRNEANEKRYPPSLDDDVFRLEEIAKNGPYRRRLQYAKIITVQEFLKALNKDPNELRKILKMENQNNSWSRLTGHARQCFIEDMPELKKYQSEEGNVVLFFNCVHNLVGAEFGCGYVTSDDFSSDQKALVNKWKGRAYDILDNIASDYVIKGNVPEPISSQSRAAAAAGTLMGGALQPIISTHSLTAPQGTGLVEESPRSGINNITPPIFPNANNNDGMSLSPVYLNPNEYQGNGTALQSPLNQQPIILDSNMPDIVTLMNSLFGDASIDGVQVPMRGEAACFCFAIGPQPSCAEHGQGPSSSQHPGSGHSNDNYQYVMKVLDPMCDGGDC